MAEVGDQQVGGTQGTREYYQDEGWEVRDGVVVEHDLFGVKEDGPLRQAAFAAMNDRIHAALDAAGPPLNLLELGCGGQPAIAVLGHCHAYTGLDFSAPGLALAEEVLRDFSIDVELVEGDMCELPFEDGQFDAVHSEHALYHIADVPSQTRAFEEIVRVLRPGGVATLIVCNPRPLAFPGRMAKRLIAENALLAGLANRVREAPPIPFRPLTVKYMREILEPHGRVEVVTAGMATVEFNQRVTEKRGLGKKAWQAIAWLEINKPELAGRLGNYVLITFAKR